MQPDNPPLEERVEEIKSKGGRVIGSYRIRHLTTIAGPQAEAILKLKDSSCDTYQIKNKSVPGLAVVEIWGEFGED